jgi:hypothetical protein
MKKSQTFSRYLAIIISALLLVLIFLVNSVPLTIHRTFISNQRDVLALNPINRVKNSDLETSQIDNLIYFSTKMPVKYDDAKIMVKFNNPTNDRQIFIGYQDQNTWHYNTQVLDSPFMNNLSWSKIGSGPYLYQKFPTYSSLPDFFKHPPENKVVGIYDYSDSSSLQSHISLPNYKPSKSSTTINAALRGKVTMFAYLENEPFKMSFTKQDLNWYADPDTAKISVFKGDDNVYTANIDDDGNATNNHKIGSEQTITIQNPGPGLPENGVYKIVIDISNDTVIKNISTNLHKIVFEGPIYIADNHEIYGRLIKKSKSSIITTNAQNLSFISEHDQSSKITIGNNTLNLDQPNKILSAKTTSPITNVIIPRSDVVVNGDGYFALSSEHFFEPSPYRILPINNQSDIDQADYIISNYPGKPVQDGQWSVAMRNFKLNDAFIDKNRRLSWILSVPGLKEHHQTIIYKQLEMTLSKNGWLEK